MHTDDDNKWGRRAAFVVAIVGVLTTITVFGGLMMGGGGCEGHAAPCTPDHGPVWLIVLAIALGFAVLGWATHFLFGRVGHARRARTRRPE